MNSSQKQWIQGLFFSGLFLTTQVSAQSEGASLSVTTAQKLAGMPVDTVKNLVNIIMEFMVKYSFQALGGIIVLVIGWFVGKYLASLVTKLLSKHIPDVIVIRFIAGGVKLAVLMFAFMVALEKFGVQITPLIAGIGVTGAGVALALQGTLSNIAAGITLIFTKPFKVGEIIEVVGVMGEVVDIKLPRTDLKTVDGHIINVPNKHIIGEIIHNYSDAKRLDIFIGVGYKTDVDKALKIITQVIESDKRFISQRNLKVGIDAFADSSINILARFFVKQDHYWDAKFGINKNILAEFNKQNIEIPFPQHEVYLHNVSEEK